MSIIIYSPHDYHLNIWKTLIRDFQEITIFFIANLIHF